MAHVHCVKHCSKFNCDNESRCSCNTKRFLIQGLASHTQTSFSMEMFASSEKDIREWSKGHPEFVITLIQELSQQVFK